MANICQASSFNFELEFLNSIDGIFLASNRMDCYGVCVWLDHFVLLFFVLFILLAKRQV